MPKLLTGEKVTKWALSGNGYRSMLAREVVRLRESVKKLEQHIKLTSPRTECDCPCPEMLRAEEIRLWKRADHVSGFAQELRPKLYAQFDRAHPSFLKA